MKALRYLFILMGMVSMLRVGAQGLVAFPSVDFRSTSTMAGSGSKLPQAAKTGAMLSDATPLASRPDMTGMIKSSGNPFEGGGTAGEVTTPIEPGTPVGDAMIPLSLMLLIYVGRRVVMLRREEKMYYLAGKKNV